MIDITVQLRRADGGSSTYAAILCDGTDRSIHEVVVPHSVAARYEQEFDSSSAMIERLFELLLEEEPPERIRSSFDIRDLFLHRPQLVSMLLERSEGEAESLREWLAPQDREVSENADRSAVPALRRGRRPSRKSQA